VFSSGDISASPLLPLGRGSILSMEPLTYQGFATTAIEAGLRKASFQLTADCLHEDFVVVAKVAERLQSKAWLQGPWSAGRFGVWSS
jgi:hypothetical protein